MIHPVPHSPGPIWLVQDYLGVAQAQIHSPNFVPETPRPATAELLGLGLGIKGFQDFPLEMSSPQEAGQLKRNHTTF